MSKYPVIDIKPETTAQEVFTAINKHLEEQGKACTLLGDCVNRGPDNMACAAACLISDEDNVRIAGVNLTRILLNQPDIFPHLCRFSDLIADCQLAHDRTSINKGNVKSINNEMDTVAARYKLKWVPLTKWS